MSAILKALKKIEKETGREAQSQSFSRRLDAKKLIHQRARKAWRVRRVISILVPFMVIVTVIVLIIAFKAFSPEDAVLLPPVPQVHGGDKKAGATSRPERKGEYAQVPKGVLRPQPPTAEKGVLGSTPASSPVPGRPSAFEENPETGTAEKTTSRSLLPAETQSQSHPEPGLELQAIVWSDDPASCFAVINGRIVRSGGMVAGVSVVAIAKEAVSLKRGEKTWTMRMLEGD